ncbi:hypothetical protein HBB16_13905 [Pseudonocardia sp. MCCB 268]|nr:hypothetical protein [Pseudonocardia cytotoxica]
MNYTPLFFLATSASLWSARRGLRSRYRRAGRDSCAVEFVWTSSLKAPRYCTAGGT